MLNLSHLNPLKPIQRIFAYSAQLDRSRELFWQPRFRHSFAAINNSAVTVNRRSTQTCRITTVNILLPIKAKSLAAGRDFVANRHQRLGADVISVGLPHNAMSNAEPDLLTQKNRPADQEIKCTDDVTTQSACLKRRYASLESIHQNKLFLTMAERAEPSEQPSAVREDAPTLEVLIRKSKVFLSINRLNHTNNSSEPEQKTVDLAWSKHDHR